MEAAAATGAGKQEEGSECGSCQVTGESWMRLPGETREGEEKKKSGSLTKHKIFSKVCTRSEFLLRVFIFVYCVHVRMFYSLKLFFFILSALEIFCVHFYIMYTLFIYSFLFLFFIDPGFHTHSHNK